MEAHGFGKPAKVERDIDTASASSRSRCKIDVGRYVAEMEHVLRANGDRSARMQALAILGRWQFDDMLDDASRQRAKLLVSIFAYDKWKDA